MKNLLVSVTVLGIHGESRNTTNEAIALLSSSRDLKKHSNSTLLNLRAYFFPRDKLRFILGVKDLKAIRISGFYFLIVRKGIVKPHKSRKKIKTV